MTNGRRLDWRGPQPSDCEELIVNAPDDLFTLTPASQAQAVATRAKWAALMSSDDEPPLIWEALR